MFVFSLYTSRIEARVAVLGVLPKLARGLCLLGIILSLGLVGELNNPASVWAETYYGQVVDEETGKPLEGVGIAVIWYRVPYVYMDRSRTFHSAQETLTDRAGKFSLEVAPGIDWSPFTQVLKDPDIVVFKPEYKPLLGLSPFAITGSVLRLQKLKRKEEQLDILRMGLGTTLVPQEKIPTLTKLINDQRKTLNLPPVGRNSK